MLKEEVGFSSDKCNSSADQALVTGLFKLHNVVL